jgi:hypothetical protein
MTNPRRDFLGWLGASALLGTTASPLSASSADAAAPRALATTFDMSWTERLTGKYRAVFDSPELSEGAALFRAIIWQDNYQEIYGTDAKTMTPVIVFRHTAISLIMNDSYWATFEVGKSAKMKTPEGKKWAVANPIRVSPAGTPPKWAKYNLENFIASGGIVLACNLAFGEVVSAFQEKEKIKVRDDARKRALEHVIPGVILQPTGVFAVLRAQEGGCHYILAS